MPSQLVVLLEGVTKNNAKTLKEGLGSKPAFSIADPPSAQANKYFIDNELSSVAGSCDVAAAIDPYSSCWNGLSLVVKYDVGKVSLITQVYGMLLGHALLTDVAAEPRET